MKVLVLGGSGLVGSRFIKLQSDKFEIVSPSHEEFDLLKFDSYQETIQRINPELIINFAAFTNVDLAEEEKDQTDGIVYKLNTLSPRNLGLVAKQLNINLVHLSTDYVFDGTGSDHPYEEDDPTNPVNWYAKTKIMGEEFVEKSGCNYTIVRIEMPFSAEFGKKKDIVRTFLDLLKEGREIIATQDQNITPTFVDFGVKAIAEIVNQKKTGIYHIGATNFTTPYLLAKMIAIKFNLDENLIKPTSFEQYNQTRTAKRPKDSWLSVEKFKNEIGQDVLGTIEGSLDIFAEQIV